MNPTSKLWVWLREGSFNEAIGWLASILTNLICTTMLESVQIFEGTYVGTSAWVRLELDPEGYLLIMIQDHVCWPARGRMAHDAFQVFHREVRWVPDGEHYPGEVFVLDTAGERRVDWQNAGRYAPGLHVNKGWEAWTNPRVELWIWVRDGTFEDASSWLAGIISSLHQMNSLEGFQVFEGQYDGKAAAVVMEIQPPGYLEIQIQDNVYWLSRRQMAHDAFQEFHREVRWVPDDEHYPGEVFVLDTAGERRVDWDEELEQ